MHRLLDRDSFCACRVFTTTFEHAGAHAIIARERDDVIARRSHPSFTTDIAAF
jgi:hypothetical protein